ncbi:hypothetical protein V8G54_019768 [Vigna mungo]|uniref:OTU domain-containing protein n=1 Tax=Vigna mungo TaxID=3915 RepID=A0AAQ3RU33_VIGMU
MGKLFCDSTTVTEPFQGSLPVVLPWRDPKSESITTVDLIVPTSVGGATFTDGWEDVVDLEKQQRCHLQKLHAKCVLWKPLEEVEDSSSSSSPSSSSHLRSVISRFSHSGEVSTDGNCLFTASLKAKGGEEVNACELRWRIVTRLFDTCTLQI